MITTNYFADKSSQNEMSDEDISLLFLIPLVQMAWAHGAISPREKQVIFDAAREEGIDHRSSLNDMIDNWLVYQPGRQFYDECLLLIATTLREMTVRERQQKRNKLLDRCRTVAASAGDRSPMDTNHRISPEEKELLAELEEMVG